MILNEYTKKQLIKRSKSKEMNRYNRRMQVSNSDIELQGISLVHTTPEFRDLIISFKVKDYVVKIQLVGFSKILLDLINSKRYANSKLRDVIMLAIDKSLKHKVRVSCSCPDFYYRFSYIATKLDYGYNTNQYIPARIRNPEEKGSMCKHATRVMNAPSLWKSKVTTSLVKAIRDNPRILI